jgi:hypothetical protein
MSARRKLAVHTTFSLWQTNLKADVMDLISTTCLVLKVHRNGSRIFVRDIYWSKIIVWIREIYDDSEIASVSFLEGLHCDLN